MRLSAVSLLIFYLNLSTESDSSSRLAANKSCELAVEARALDGNPKQVHDGFPTNKSQEETVELKIRNEAGQILLKKKFERWVTPRLLYKELRETKRSEWVYNQYFKLKLGNKLLDPLSDREPFFTGENSASLSYLVMSLPKYQLSFINHDHSKC